MSVSGSGSGSSTASLSPSISSPPGSPLCGIVVFPTGTWVANTGGAGATVSLSIGANTIANDPCFGTVTVPVSNSGGGAGFNTITLNNVKLPARSGRADRVCTINAILTSPTTVYKF